MKVVAGIVLLFLGFVQLGWGQTNGSTSMAGTGKSEMASAVRTTSYVVFGATAQQEALVRSQIQTMQPAVFPLRIVFVPHWKYMDNARIFDLHVPTGYTSALFTHLPSRTIFIDADRYFDESLGYWLAHEVGHLVTNSAKEQDAERASRELRKRLESALKRTSP